MSSRPKTHNALVQPARTQPLTLQTLPTPQPCPGTAIIQIISAPVLSYSKEVLNGTRPYPYPTPFTPGASGIGRVAALGHDSTALSVGQLVYVDSVIRSRDEPADIMLLGVTQGGTAGSAKLMKDVWRNGVYADYCAVPLENAIPVNEEKLRGLGYQDTDMASLGRYLVPFGGLRDVDVEVGETVIVTPATGAFGGAAVAVALAIGASVIAMGRSEEKLKGLVEHFGADRVKTVKITGDVAGDTEALLKAAGGPVDVVYEISPPMAAKSTHLMSAVMALKHSGRVSLMGGILEDYPFPIRVIMRKNITLKGKWMYERSDIFALIRMVEVGALKIGVKGGIKTVGNYEFKDWEEAFEVASKEAGWNASVFMRSSSGHGV